MSGGANLEKLSPVNLGQQDRSVDLGGFVLTETVRPPALTLRPHFHQHTNISFVVRGAFVETIGKRAHECAPNDCIIRPAGEVHFNEYKLTQARSLIIEVKPHRLEAIRQVSNVLDRAACFRRGAIAVFGLRIYEEFQAMDGVSPLSIEALTLEMVVLAARNASRGFARTEPRWLRQAHDLIHDQFAQRLSLFSVAEAVGVHPAHLARMFRKHYHSTIGDYVRRLQLDYAIEQLTRSDRPLAEIASAAGFYDQSHFTHAFKRRLGTTPARFRAATRQS